MPPAGVCCCRGLSLVDEVLLVACCFRNIAHTPSFIPRCRMLSRSLFLLVMTVTVLSACTRKRVGRSIFAVGWICVTNDVPLSRRLQNNYYLYLLFCSRPFACAVMTAFGGCAYCFGSSVMQT